LIKAGLKLKDDKPFREARIIDMHEEVDFSFDRLPLYLKKSKVYRGLGRKEIERRDKFEEEEKKEE
jgi:hypothetical protein